MWEQVNGALPPPPRGACGGHLVGPAALSLPDGHRRRALFEGVTDATMGHGEGWQYLQAGRFLERADATAALVDLHFKDTAGRPSGTADHMEWVGLLRSCSALEASCRCYTADLRARAHRRVPAAQPGVPAFGAICGGRVESALRTIAQLTAAAPAGAPSGSPAGCTPRSTTGRWTRSSARIRTPTSTASDGSARRSTRPCTELHRLPDRVGAAGVSAS